MYNQRSRSFSFHLFPTKKKLTAQLQKENINEDEELTHVYDNRSTYMGKLNKNKRFHDENAIFVFANQDKYQGPFENGLREGNECLMTYKIRKTTDKSHIETIVGPMKNDKFTDGIYKITYRDKSVYIGQVLSTTSKQEIPNQPCLEEIKRHGFGVMEGLKYHIQGKASPTTEHYYGYWSNDQYDGFGVLLVPGHLQYYGNFKAQYQHGPGVKLYVKDFSRFECHWEDGAPMGQGKFFAKHIEITGHWDENEITKGTFTKPNADAKKEKATSLFNMFNIWDNLLGNSFLTLEQREYPQTMKQLKEKESSVELQTTQFMILIENDPRIQDILSKFSTYFEIKYRTMKNHDHIKTHIIHDIHQIVQYLIRQYDIIFQKEPLLQGFALKRYFHELVVNSLGEETLSTIYNIFKKLYLKDCVKVDVAMTWLQSCPGEVLNMDKSLIPPMKNGLSDEERCQTMKEMYLPVIQILLEMKQVICPLQKIKMTVEVCDKIQQVLNIGENVIDFEHIIDATMYSFIHAHYDTLHVDYQYMMTMFHEGLKYQEIQYVMNIDSALKYMTSFQYDIRNEKNALYPLYQYNKNFEKALKNLYIQSSTRTLPLLNDIISLLLKISQEKQLSPDGWYFREYQNTFLEYNTHINTLISVIHHEIIFFTKETIPEIQLESPTPLPNNQKPIDIFKRSNSHFHIVPADSDDTSEDMSEEDEDDDEPDSPRFELNHNSENQKSIRYLIQAKIYFPPTFYVTLCETIKTFMLKHNIK